MEPARKRGRSEMWQYFELIAHDKVRCLLCTSELKYHNNTSSMKRHFTAKHSDQGTSAAASATSGVTQENAGAGAGAGREVRPLASEDYETMAACIAMLNPFKKATNELSEEKRVSGSVAIPMTKMLFHSIIDLTGQTSHATAKILGQNLIQQLTSRFDGQEDSTACNLATLLDPRFKMIGFRNQGCAQAAMRRLVSECASVMRTSLQLSTTNQPEPAHPAIPSADNETPAASTEVRPLASEDYETMAACIAMLNPFKKATNELSEEKRVSGSVAIPMTKMLFHSIIDLTGQTSHATAKILGQNLIQQLTSRFDGQEDSTACNLATLLDPRFKMIGFRNQGCAQAAMRRLVSECASVMRTSLQLSTTNQPEPAHPAIPSADNETPAASTGYIIKIIYTNYIYQVGL
ncbi:zinc finger BED domain-containing protein 1-like [Xyrichtys novacula]|uniref:Zinc finger BED domain-containing protein 1-like n=1 Tax=Xyrichtys novacula TaxID=13765 RepID=A0AAV1EX99_XYRNO|nr:zinc finger BED domain-containing protein 1-like [Xyrichtys novacula]